MKLPIKNPHLKMYSNKEQALLRLHCLSKKLTNNQRLYTQYKEYMKVLISNGYAEKVPDVEYDQKLNCYYIPHHGVYSSQKPDNLRVVFDCSAKFN